MYRNKESRRGIKKREKHNERTEGREGGREGGQTYLRAVLEGADAKLPQNLLDGLLHL
jgi:hypothetical protein